MPQIASRTPTWTDTLDQRYRQAKPPLLVTAFAAVGIIYGDIGTSPLYVMNGIFRADGPPPSPEEALGAISAIIWTLTLVPLIKYSLIALEFGTGEGEGGPFALFAQMYPPEKEGSELALPSIHSIGDHFTPAATSFLARPGVKPIIRIITLFAVALIMSDGILTPAVSVSSAVSGIALPVPSLNSTDITGISIAILAAIFLSQRFGTQLLALSFAPIVTIWLLLLAGTGIYNITLHPAVFRALDPSRAIMFFIRAKSITPMSGILLAITGVEALFANLGQFSKGAIRLSFIVGVYPALILAYLGQGATMITQGSEVISNIFYRSIPGPQGGVLWWIIWSFALLATVVASQAMITASFSLIQQMVGLKSFPPVRIIHTSDSSQGQIYAPAINFLLLVGTIGVTAGFGADESLTSAYGFAVAGVLITTTFLMTMVMIHVKGLPIWLALGFFVLAGFIDACFFASSLQKIPHGAWFTLSLGCMIGLFLLFWSWAKGLEDKFDAEHRVKLSQLLIKYSADRFTIDSSPMKNESGGPAGQEKGDADSDPQETDALRGFPSAPITPATPVSANHLRSELMLHPLHISDLALHEEPQEIESEEITEGKTAGIDSEATDEGKLRPTDPTDENLTGVEQSHKITIAEPHHRKRPSTLSFSNYPPVHGVHQLAKHISPSPLRQVVEVPAELVAAGSRTPSPKTKASQLVGRFLAASEPAVSVQLGDHGHLAYSHTNQALLRPRSFAAKDEVFCLFEGVLDNLGRLSQQHGLSSKGANEVLLVIEAYKTLRDRAPYPASFMLAQLTGSYAFVLFDKSTNSLLVASDPEGRVPLFWGITADGCVAFSDDIDMLKGSCGKSLAPFPQGCFYSNALGGLKCYENPKHKVTAVPADEEEICGATFKVVEGSTVLTALH